MATVARALWTEGLFLSPQSFQQQERYLYHYLESRTRPVEPYFWGISNLEIFENKLENGIFSVKRCTGVFPDGTPFDTSDCALELHVDRESQGQYIYLAIGGSDERLSEVVLETDKYKKRTSRYVAVETKVYDNQTIGAPEKSEVIMGGELNFQLFVSSEPLDDFTQIAIARIKDYDTQGAIYLDTEYIPPLQYSLQSLVLKSAISRIHSQLVTRGKILANRLINPSVGGVSDIIDFNLLQIINRYTPLFSYYIQEEKTHPREIYLHALQLVGELATIAHDDKVPDEYPGYTQGNLQETFGCLFSDIERYLQYSTVPKALSIPLYVHENYPTVYKTEHIPESVFDEHSRFVLSVSGDLPLAVLQEKIQTITTLASTIDLLQQLVSAHTPGIPLIPLPAVPREIPYHANCVYLDVNISSKHWQQVRESRHITAHIDSLIPAVKFEIWAIRDK